MRVHFSSDRLQRLCESQKELRRKYGALGEKRIRERIDDLMDAPHAAALATFAGHFEVLQHDLKGSMSVRVHDGYRIVFRPYDDPPPTKPDGGLDLQAITSIVIESVKDYH